MAEDEVRSTTPPLPPPESSETQPQQHVRARSQDRPTSPRREAQADPVETQSHKMESDRQSKLPRPAHSRTPEPIRVPQSNHQANRHNRGQTPSLTHAAHLAAEEQSSSPGTPGHLTPFDWDDLDARFDKALADANAHEADLMAEFASLVKVGWTEAASCKTGFRLTRSLSTSISGPRPPRRTTTSVLPNDCRLDPTLSSSGRPTLTPSDRTVSLLSTALSASAGLV